MIRRLVLKIIHYRLAKAMKKIFDQHKGVVLFYCLFIIGCGQAVEQAVLQSELTQIVTEDDIQVCSPKKSGGNLILNWKSPKDIRSITYSDEPLAEQKLVASRLMVWEGKLNQDDLLSQKVVIEILVNEPKQCMIGAFRFRTRWSDDSEISDWSVLSPVIILPDNMYLFFQYLMEL